MGKGRDRDRFGLIASAILMTTDVDRHGDKFTVRAVRSAKRQFDENPALKFLKNNHDVNDTVGEVLRVKLKQKGDWCALEATVGIYKERQDIIDKINSGEYGGFSVSGSASGATFEEGHNKVSIYVDPREKWEIHDYLEKHGIENDIIFRKSEDILSIIQIASPFVVLGLECLYDYWQQKKKDSKEGPKTVANETDHGGDVNTGDITTRDGNIQTGDTTNYNGDVHIGDKYIFNITTQDDASIKDEIEKLKKRVDELESKK